VLEHGGESVRVDGLALPDSHRAGSLVVVAGRDDSLGSGTMAPSYRKMLTWSLAASRAQILPRRTKYGRLVRLIVSKTSGSAAWARSRTSRQKLCCQWGKASM
jgi:hypothetical protein